MCEENQTQEEIVNGFSKFCLQPQIIEALEKLNFTTPSQIQQESIPPILAGKDIIALSPTGSGKTAACAIPLCNLVDTNQKKIQALVVVPTRELALQYATEVSKFGKHKLVQVIALLGGNDLSIQQSKLDHGVQVVVATPGRLIDFIYARQIDLTEVKTLVLDEADEMLSMGFQDDLSFIIDCLVQSHQTLLFSATMLPAILKIAKNYMVEPLTINLTSAETTPATLSHNFVYVNRYNRADRLNWVLSERSSEQIIVFCNSRVQVEKVCFELKKTYKNVDFLHAGLTQGVRDIVTKKFKNKKINCLVATDVVARGLDFSFVTLVINFQLPKELEVYIHRSGRTGRNGKVGQVVSLVERKELGYIKKLLSKIDREATWLGASPER